MADKNYSVDLNVSVGATLDEASVKKVERIIEERLSKKVTYVIEGVEDARVPQRKAQRPSDISFGDIFRKNLFRGLPELMSKEFKGMKFALPKFELGSRDLGEMLSKKQDAQSRHVSEKLREYREMVGDVSKRPSVKRTDFDSVTDEIELVREKIKSANEAIDEIAKLTEAPTLNVDAIKRIGKTSSKGVSRVDAVDFEVSSLITEYAGLDSPGNSMSKFGKTTKQKIEEKTEKLRKDLEELDRLDVESLAQEGLESFSFNESIPYDIRKKINNQILEIEDLQSQMPSSADVKQAVDKFTVIGNKVIPSMAVAIEAYEKSLVEAGQLGVPVGAYENKFAIQAGRQAGEIYSGESRPSLGDSSQAKRVTSNYQSTLGALAKNPETKDALNAWMDNLLSQIAKEVYQATLEDMQKSADYFAAKEYKGGEFDTGYITKSESEDISTGSNMLGYKLEEFTRRFIENTLKRGFDPGSHRELAQRALENEVQSGKASWQDETFLGFAGGGSSPLQQGFLDLSADISGLVQDLETQVFYNPAIVTTKPLGGGAQKEIKELTIALPEQIKQIKELGTAAVTASESVKSLRDEAKESSNAELDISKAEFEAESAKDYASAFQKLADDETRSLEERAASAKTAQAKALEQAELEKKLADLKAKQTTSNISAIQAEPKVEIQPEATQSAEAGFDKISKTVLEGLDKILASGGKFVAAFDSEFVHETANVITEAAVVLQDEAGKFYNVMDLLHAPPASQQGMWEQARVGVKNMEQLKKRASDLGYADPLGAGEGVKNLQDFYPKLKALIDVINKLADLGIPLATAAGQSADFNRIARAIQNVNTGISENKLDLPQLLAPAGPYSKKAMNDYPLAFQNGHDPRGQSTEVDIQKVMKDLTGPEAGQIRAMADGKVKVGALVRALYDKLGEDVKSLITLTEKVNKKTGQKELGFTVSGDPAHTARADAKATAAILKYLSSISGSAPSPAAPKPPKPPAGLDGREQSGIPDNGYEPFLIQLKGMNSVLSSMQKTEQEIFLEKLKQFKNSEGQERLYGEILDRTQKIAAIQKSGASGPEAKAKIESLQKEILQLQVLGEANERRLASDVKFNARFDNFASDRYDTFKQEVDGVYAVEEADKAARASIIRGIKEQVAAEKSVEAQTKSLLNTWVTGRYALYDVGNAYAGVARQLWMASRQIFNITQAYRSYETAFTSVERAVQPFAASLEGVQSTIDDVKNESLSLKQSLIGLSETIPVTFEDLASIATLGAQMGVAASGIAGFTETVAKFSAITGVSADTVAQKFGRIAELANVDYSEFNNLGSSILYAGINAVATESEIMSLAESIAAVSAQAAFAPQEIVGMATALASTGIQAEQARGVFTRVFADIDRAVSVGGKELNSFASVAGMSAKDFQQAWGTEGASYDVFRAILGGLGSTADLTAAFDKLNIVETREINTLTRLASNLNVVDQAIGDAGGSFESGSFLSESFEKTVDNLDSKIKTFNNNLKSLSEELSSGMATGLGLVIDVANGFLQVLKEIAKNPIASGLATASLGVTAFGAVVSLAVSGVAKLIAQIYAFRVAAINTANDTTAVSGIRSMLKQLTGFSSGLIEMRDQLQAPSAATRGVITPTTFKMFDSMEKRKQKLIDQDNIYLATLKGRGDQAVAAARMEADSINQIIMARRNEIATIEMSQNMTADEKAEKLAAIGGHKIYTEVVNGEVRALTALEYAKLKEIQTSGTATKAQQAEATARLANTKVLTTQTRVASMAGSGVLGLGTKFLGAATLLGTVLTVLTTAYGLFEMLRVSAESTKFDFLEAGGGTASLRDAIKSDTQEYMKLNEKQRLVSDEFTTVTVKTKKQTSAVNDNAVSIKNWTGTSEKFVSANKDVIEGVEDSTIALGENTRAWFANAVNQDENFQSALEKYPTLLNDLSSMGLDFSQIINDIFNNPDVDPSGPIVKQIDNVSNRIGVLKKEQADLIKGGDTTGGGATNAPRLAEIKKELDGLNEQKDKLDLTKEAIDSVREALGTAIQKNTIYEAINDALGITNQMDNAILDLQDAFAEAAKSGTGMAEVMANVKTAVITMLKDIDAADPEIIAQVNSEDTIGGLISITQALAETTKAAALAEAGLTKVGSSAFWSTGYLSAFKSAVTASNYDEIMQVVKSLQALAVASTVSPESTGGETLADKLNRLVTESFAAVDALMAVRSATEALGQSLSESKDWSTLTDSGRNNLEALQGVITSIGERARGDFGKATTELKILKIAMQDAGYTTENAGLAFRTIDKAILALGGTASLTKKEIAALRKQFPSLFKEISNGLTQSATKDPFFKTITEYASGIANAMKNALDFRYGQSSAYDALTQSWLDIKEAAESAAEAVKSADETIKGLNADRDMIVYKLSVAERYGDTARAAKLRAELEKANRDITDATKERAQAQEESTKTLKGDSAGAIKNRTTVRGLVQTYTDYLASLANSGMSAADLKKEAAKLSAEFLTQGKNLGFAEDELKSYTAAFESDFITIVNQLEQFRGDITLSVNTDPALRAISEFVLAANEALAKVISVTPGAGTTAPTAPEPFVVDQAALTAINEKIANAERYAANMERLGKWAEFASARTSLDKYYAERRKIQGLAAGGFVSGEGSSTSDSIPAMLSNGEFVMNAKSVKSYGLGFFNALNQQRVAFSPVGAASRQQQAGPSIVFLSPEDRQLLRQFGERPVNLYADSTKIAEVANTGNTKMSRRGSR